MKAAQINSYGGQGALEVASDVAKPTAEEGQVIVEVHAASTNPFDWKVREGYMKEFILLKFPAILGGDLAGTVAEVGSGVTEFQVGQSVYGMAGAASGHGSYAEFAPVPATQLAAKPEQLSFTEAAALPLAAISAYQAVVDTMQLQAGQKILIHGGAGGIGSLAIQIAKHIGAYIATTADPADADFVKSLGADEVINYKTQDFSTILKDYDAVFDTVGGEANTKSYAVLKNGGALVSMVQPIDENLAAQKDIHYTQQASKATQQRLTAISELVAAGDLSVHIDKVFPLDQAPEALEYLKTGHSKGKVVIQVIED